MSLALKLSKLRFKLFSSHRQDFYEDFASALRDGASSHTRLKKLSERSRRRKTGWTLLYQHWLHKMKRMSFANALQHTAPSYEVMVLTAAEEDGRLEEAMLYLGRSLRLLRKIKGIYFMSLISPILSFAVILAFFVSYALVIAPQNIQTLPIEKWPPLSHGIYTVSNALVTHWMGFLSFAVVIGSLIIWSRPNWYGRSRRLVDKIPLLPWSGYRESSANTFLLSLAILLQSNNHGMKASMERMRQYSSPWLAWHINTMLQRLSKAPDNPALALETGIFSQRIMDRIEDYSERSDFYKAMHTIAFDHGESAVEAAEKKAVFIGLIAMLFSAMAIGLIFMGNLEFNGEIERYISQTK
ncbi:hypothetical protein [Delftia sp. PS-11]|uniref:hypothetical protein n=1 Tax=Delftia sp. PS-11 TaxID=2767222 RepID=UPI002453F483|nr:hypothetical protein [Delftia sp. PS-11]KAJ8744160.1 type II secretion system F family protein [Delftia sp. PS-11]